jgi:RNA polymerase sigma-70 factor (ECF subfamily)
MDQASDETLMTRYRGGEAAAFDRLYARHKGGLYRYLLRQCGNRGTAEELFQDVWMSLIRGRAAYVDQGRFAAWLYRIAHNRLMDHYRAQPGGVPRSFDEEDGPSIDALPAHPGADPARRVEAREEARLVLHWIEQLPHAQREAFVMQQEAGMSVEEIAQATGVARETAKSRLRYAIASLRAARAAAVRTTAATAPAPVRGGATLAAPGATDAGAGP